MYNIRFSTKTFKDAPDPTDAEHHAPLHGHTGAVPSDKALSDTGVLLDL